MQLNISQQMKMSQQMKLAPRMIQSMEILQLPALALSERIEQEMTENPVLELTPSETDGSTDEASSSRSETTETVDAPARNEVEQKELVVDNEHNNESDFERLLEISSEWPEDNVSAGSRPSSNRIEEDGERKHDAMANMTARPQSLHEYLLEQFAFFNCPPEIRGFGEYLIQNLDNNGRLPSSLPEVVQVFGHPISMDQAEETLQMIQRLDPPGVGARDHREMLLLQVTPELPFHDVVVALISNHLEDVAHNRLPVIQRKTGYALDVIKIGIEQLQQLNPYPGRGFEQRPVQRVTPDLSVERDDSGTYVVKLEDEYIPELRISAKYASMLKSDPTPETREWIKRKVESAKWLIDSIEQRYSTLKKVAQAIVDHQTAFLDSGPEHIVPLKMQQIADVVGVHVTTVSRAVDDKWIQTPRGLFPLKRFFGGGTQTANGEEVAWDIIRIKLREIIDGENKQHPAQRRRSGRSARRAGLSARPANDYQIPQADEHPLVAPAPRILIDPIFVEPRAHRAAFEPSSRAGFRGMSSPPCEWLMKRYKSVDDYIAGAEHWQVELIRLREILQSTKLEETVKWGAPCYTHNGKMVVGLGAFKSYVGLWFHQGALLSDPEKVLINAQEGKTKALRQWRFSSLKEIKARPIKGVRQRSRAVAGTGPGNQTQPQQTGRRPAGTQSRLQKERHSALGVQPADQGQTARILRPHRRSQTC